MAAPKTHTNVAAVWKAHRREFVNVSGTWKEIVNAYVNVSGVWKKTHTVYYDVISSHVNQYNLRTVMMAKGWDGSSPAVFTVVINSGIFVYSSTTSSPAFLTGPIPAGCYLRIVNNGYIIGQGGIGGAGDGVKSTLPTAGGIAMDLDTDISANTYIVNGNGYILGGGGGGGQSYAAGSTIFAGGGGGAGGGHGGYSEDPVHVTGPLQGTLVAPVPLTTCGSGTYDNNPDDYCAGASGGGRLYNGGASTGAKAQYSATFSAASSAGAGGAGGIVCHGLTLDGSNLVQGGNGGASNTAGGNASITGTFDAVCAAGGGGGGYGRSGGNGASYGSYVGQSGAAGGKAIELNSGGAPTFESGGTSPHVEGSIA